MNYKLYKTDSKDRLRVWEGTLNGDSYIIKTGLVTGKLNIAPAVLCNPKNKGRANETSGAEQAEAEIKSKYTKKLREGYFLTIEEAENTKVILPMLAYKTKDDIDLSKGAYASRKLDGHRMLAHITKNGVKLVTRTNKEYTTLEHIKQDLAGVYAISGPCILDGEVYNHNLSFQENTRIIKKYRKGETETLSYNVYDVVQAKPAVDRILSLLELFVANTLKHVNYVDQYLIKTTKELEVLYAQFIEEGYEGVMLKMPGYNYEVNKRSKGLQKYKKFLDKEFYIIDVIAQDKRPEQGIVILETDDKKQFTANLKGSWGAREQLLQDRIDYIGKWGTVEYFEMSDDGIPRFPVFKAIREDQAINVI